MSSAKPWRLIAYLLITFLSGRRYTWKRRGQRTDPWGTPVDSGASKDTLLLIFTARVRPLRYDCIHESAVSVNPTSLCSLSNKREWSLVWNAALRSRRTRSMASPSSRTSSMSALFRRMAVSVLSYFLMVKVISMVGWQGKILKY